MKELETRARRRDPDTSRAAAEGQAADQVRASQARVLSMFKLYGDMTDQALLSYLNDAERQAGLRPMSPSGARSRRSELSKPNEARLLGLRQLWYREHAIYAEGRSLGFATAEELVELERATFPQSREAASSWARAALLAEGPRSPLWDTGKREKSRSGYPMIVWGLAR